MTREEKVISSYVLMNKLKDVVRTGWKNWNVDRERVESIAEHVYGVQQLALIMYLTYKEEYKDLDLNKVILMLAIHETNEVKFAYQCDKLECDLQAALYNDNVDLNNQDNNPTSKNSKVKELLDQGMSFGEMWVQFGQDLYPYDNNFRNVSKYAKRHVNILKSINK